MLTSPVVLLLRRLLVAVAATIVILLAATSNSARAAPPRNVGGMVIEQAVYRDDSDPNGKYFILPIQQSPATKSTQLCYFFGNMTFNQTGWDYIRLTPSAHILHKEPLVAYYACGFLEAYFTWESILNNNYSTTPPKLANATQFWIRDQLSYLTDEYTAAAVQKLSVDPGGDASNITPSLGAKGEKAAALQPFAAARILRQLYGLVDGLNRALTELASTSDVKAQQWTLYDMALLSLNAELPDIDMAAALQYVGNYTTRPPGDNEPDHHGIRVDRPRPRKQLHCSAFVKMTPNGGGGGGGGGPIQSHATWAGMLFSYRQFKIYDFEVTVAMPSYPGIPSSVDDMAYTGAKLVIHETTNDQENETLARDYVKPTTVPYFIRWMSAAYFAETAPAWVRLFLDNWNSGTYNNQQQIVDYKLYNSSSTLGAAALPADFFWVASQMPGPFSRSADETSKLRQADGNGAWWSYNIPFFKTIRKLNGDAALKNKYGDVFSYQQYSRAKIFHERGPGVNDVASAMKLIRYNDWENDPNSVITNCTGCNPKNNAFLTIAARGDLVPATASYGDLSAVAQDFYSGPADLFAIDGKIVTWDAMMNVGHVDVNGRTTVTGHDNNSDGTCMQAWVIAGPTNDQQPTFKWSTAPADVRESRHVGQPDAWNFGWQLQTVCNMRLSPAASKHFASRKVTTMPPSANNGGGGGSNTGRNVGIIVGSLVGLALVAIGLVFLIYGPFSDRLCKRGAARRSAREGIADASEVAVAQGEDGETAAAGADYQQHMDDSGSINA